MIAFIEITSAKNQEKRFINLDWCSEIAKSDDGRAIVFSPDGDPVLCNESYEDICLAIVRFEKALGVK